MGKNSDEKGNRTVSGNTKNKRASRNSQDGMSAGRPTATSPTACPNSPLKGDDGMAKKTLINDFADLKQTVYEITQAIKEGAKKMDVVLPQNTRRHPRAGTDFLFHAAIELLKDKNAGILLINHDKNHRMSRKGNKVIFIEDEMRMTGQHRTADNESCIEIPRESYAKDCQFCKKEFLSTQLSYIYSVEKKDKQGMTQPLIATDICKECAMALEKKISEVIQDYKPKGE